ncbi:MAG: YhdT family protein, partial [Candidatus Aminicenantes bacterium]|nr:YhdT family protein [Candidatus Aminicenantes bacterium]
YLLFIMGSSYLLGIRPYIWGLPRWVFIGNIIVPVVFVLLLIFLAERFIPDIPLTKDEDSKREE